MTKKKLIEYMKDVIKNHRDDIEMLHFHLDELLLEYINDKEVKRTFNSVGKWYA